MQKLNTEKFVDLDASNTMVETTTRVIRDLTIRQDDQVQVIGKAYLCKDMT
jgi:hypothetical protein